MPYLPEQREYRNFAASNFQPVMRDIEDGTEEKEPFTVRGHFTTFDQPYELFPGYFETIDRHALDETDMSDTLFQYNHGGPVLARLRNGSLQVGIDPDGGWARADLSGCQQARDLYEAINNGLIDRMSFGFTIAEDGFEWEEDEDGTIHSRITKIERLYDVSAVDLPANENTDISARSYIRSAVEAKREQERLEQERAAQEEQELKAELERQLNEKLEQEREAEETATKMRLRAMALRLQS